MRDFARFCGDERAEEEHDVKPNPNVASVEPSAHAQASVEEVAHKIR